MAFLPDNNLDYPALISDGGLPFGSGFVVNHPNGIYLVTAAHVLFQDQNLLRRDKITLTHFAKRFVHKIELSVDLKAALAAGEAKRHNTADVCVVRLGSPPDADGQAKLLDQIALLSVIPPDVSIVGVGLDLIHKFDDVGISNDAFIFGYPVSIGNHGQLEPDKPLIRRGAVAGLNRARKTIIVDAAVYQGNSGGLVVEAIPKGFGQFNFRAIGVVVEFVPFHEVMKSMHFGTINTNIENSGYSVVEPMDKVLELM